MATPSQLGNYCWSFNIPAEPAKILTYYQKVKRLNQLNLGRAELPIPQYTELP